MNAKRKRARLRAPPGRRDVRAVVALLFVVVPLSGFVESVARGGWRVLDCLALALLAFLLLNVGAAIAGPIASDDD